MELFATCPFSMEGVLRREMDSLGITDARPGEGRVYFTGTSEMLARACIRLRSADRVFLCLKEFSALSFDELFDGIADIRWPEVMERTARIHVSAKCARSRLMSVPDVQRIVKKAIVTSMLRKHPSCPETGWEYPLEISVHADKVTVALDACGEGLHKRGYRVKNGPAPLRETFAAGLLLLSGYRGDRPFSDPFCGSGTLPVEAAMLARQMAPGRKRRFAAEGFLQVDGACFERERLQAEGEVLSVCAPILASDIDPEMIKLSRFHALRAGVEKDIVWECRPVKEVLPPAETGTLVTNPPYGERLCSRQQMRELCAETGEMLHRFFAWNRLVISGYREFEKACGIRADKSRRLYNANIECNAYQFFRKR